MKFAPSAMVAACLAATLMIAPASAAQDQAANSDAVPAKPEKKVCRSSVATGSVMQKRICRTKTEWAAIDRMTAKSAEQTLEHRRQSSNNLGALPN